MIARPLLIAGTLAAACVGALAVNARGDEAAPHLVPAPAVSVPAPATRQLTLAGGCFWGVAGVFEHVRGVTKAVAGYSGGRPGVGYEEVSTGTTGNAESVRITYDPAVVSEGTLLRIFFSVALDPTEHDRQGPDTGTQYRSAVFTASPAEAAYVRAYIAQLDAAHAFPAPIATEVTPFRQFTTAENYHQDFLARNPDNPYIAAVDMPKVDALRQLFPASYRATPVLVEPSAS